MYGDTQAEWNEEAARRLGQFACGWDSEDYQHVEDIRAALEEIRRLKQEFEFQSAATAALLPYQERAIKAEAGRDRLREALAGMVEKLASHSGLCCKFIDGTVLVTPESCVCEPLHKAARSALAGEADRG